MQAVGVDCQFDEEGAVRVRRVRIDGKWHAVEQGRQWLDEAGRHLLIMFPGGVVHEIVLQAPHFQWALLPHHRSGPRAV